jgi:YegS/Rv2252/BmrU family lipid kinase
MTLKIAGDGMAGGDGRRVLLVANPGARKGTEALPEAVRALRAAKFEVVEGEVGDPGDIARVIAERKAEADLIVVGGGDGTLSAALAGLVDTRLPVGILPLGTANNLARTLGIPTDVDGAVKVIAAGGTRAIDLGRVNDRYFLTTASLGLSVRITEELSDESKRRWGRMAYAHAALRVLRDARPFRATIRYDGETLETRTVQIVVGNGRFYGHAMTVAEDARIDDRQLDFYSIEVRHWWRILTLLPALRRGSHGEKSGVQALRCREITIETRVPHDIDIDGELGAVTPARFSVAAGALTVFAPPAARAPG